MVNLIFKYGKCTLIVVLICFILSCKKDKDSQNPTIEITQPYENESLNSLDTVLFKGRVSDDQNIEFIRISLKNNDNTKVLEDVVIHTDKRDFELKKSYILDDIHLPGGDYYFQVKVSDGVNESLEFISVNINTVPLEVRKVFFSSENGGQVDVYSISPENFSVSNFINQQGDYLGMLANSWNQQVYVSGSQYAGLKAYNPSEKSLLWNKNIPTTADPYFTFIDHWEKGCFTGVRVEEELRLYNEYGNLDFIAEGNQGYYFTNALLVNDDKVVTKLKNKSGNSGLIAVYYYGTGSQMQDYITVDEEVVAMFPYEEDKVIMFLNENFHAKLKVYYISGNYFNSPYGISSSPVTSAVQINKNEILFSQGTEINRYLVNSNSVLNYKSGISATAMEYDKVNDLLYVADGSQLEIYKYADGNKLKTISHGDVIRDISVLYNR